VGTLIPECFAFDAVFIVFAGPPNQTQANCCTRAEAYRTACRARLHVGFSNKERTQSFPLMTVISAHAIRFSPLEKNRPWRGTIRAGFPGIP